MKHLSLLITGFLMLISCSPRVYSWESQVDDPQETVDSLTSQFGFRTDSIQHWTQTSLYSSDSMMVNIRYTTIEEGEYLHIISIQESQDTTLRYRREKR